MLILLIVGNKKYSVGVASNCTMITSRFAKIGQPIEKLKWTHTFRQHGDLISLLIFIKKGKYATNK
jgi:hypothetical protein